MRFEKPRKGKTDMRSKKPLPEECQDEDYYVGLSREQVEKLLAGEEVGKRPYYDGIDFYTEKTISDPKNTNLVSVDGKHRYNGMMRIHIKMLTDEERTKEPDAAFSW